MVQRLRGSGVHMIALNDPKIIRDWNNASIDINAFLLQKIFQEHHAAEDVAVHNFVITIVMSRVGDQRDAFLKSVADLIEKYSLRTLGESKNAT
jgi:DUF1009 family protein